MEPSIAVRRRLQDKAAASVARAVRQGRGTAWCGATERALFGGGAILTGGSGAALGFFGLAGERPLYLSHLGIPGTSTAGIFHSVLWALAAGLVLTAVAVSLGGGRGVVPIAGCLVLAATGSVGVAELPCSPGCPFPPASPHDLGHIVAAVLLFGAVLAAVLGTALLSGDRVLRTASLWAFAVMLLAASVAGLMGLTGNAGVIGGTFQQALIAAAFGWFLLLIARRAPFATVRRSAMDAPGRDGSCVIALLAGCVLVAAVLWWRSPWPILQIWYTGAAFFVLATLALVNRCWRIPPSVWTAVLVFLSVAALAGAPWGEALGWGERHMDRLVHVAFGVCLGWATARMSVAHGRGSSSEAARAAICVATLLGTLHTTAEWTLSVLAPLDPAGSYAGVHDGVWSALQGLMYTVLGSVAAGIAVLARYGGRFAVGCKGGRE